MKAMMVEEEKDAYVLQIYGDDLDLFNHSNIYTIKQICYMSCDHETSLCLQL